MIAALFPCNLGCIAMLSYTRTWNIASSIRLLLGSKPEWHIAQVNLMTSLSIVRGLYHTQSKCAHFCYSYVPKLHDKYCIMLKLDMHSSKQATWCLRLMTRTKSMHQNSICTANECL